MLCGEWIISGPNASHEETWDCSSDKISGNGCIIQAGDTVFSEVFHLSKIEGESWTLNIQASNQNGGAYIPFFLEYWSADSLLFQNLDHDFPKRIAYAKKHVDSLHVQVDAGAGSEQGSRFTFGKATGAH